LTAFLELREQGIWVPWNSSMKYVPKYAVEGGRDDHALYVIRATFTGSSGIYVGKFAPNRGEAYVPYNNREQTVAYFDVSKLNYLFSSTNIS
jgi:hypothetical protein